MLHPGIRHFRLVNLNFAKLWKDESPGVRSSSKNFQARLGTCTCSPPKGCGRKVALGMGFGGLDDGVISTRLSQEFENFSSFFNFSN